MKVFIVGEKINPNDPWTSSKDIDVIEARNLESATKKAIEKGCSPELNTIKEASTEDLDRLIGNINSQIVVLTDQLNVFNSFLNVVIQAKEKI